MPDGNTFGNIPNAKTLMGTDWERASRRSERDELKAPLCGSASLKALGDPTRIVSSAVGLNRSGSPWVALCAPLVVVMWFFVAP
jgi:hypothetical protein